MKPRDVLSIALGNLKQRKLRTSLTTLSVVIGIAAIIGIASLGEGLRIEIGNRLQQGFELNNLTVFPGSLFAGYSREGFRDEQIQSVSRISGVELATGIMQFGNVTLYDGNKTVRALVGTAVNLTEFAQIFSDRFIFEGNSPSEYKNDTIVIGYRINHPNETETEPFAVANDTITMTLSIPQTTVFFPMNLLENRTFTVGGTLQKTGSSGITDFDYWVFVPLETAREIYDRPGSSDVIFVRVYDATDSEGIAKDIEALFPPYKITILVPLTLIKQVDDILSIVQFFLLAIASISLLVAGIGIINIMTVSVVERTREIGILKTIGAKNRTVLSMFLAEALIIGIAGGLIGLLSGYGLSYGLTYALSGFIHVQLTLQKATLNPDASRLTITPAFSSEWSIAAFLFAVIVCLVFGLYPARKASKLDPVEALRYE